MAAIMPAREVRKVMDTSQTARELSSKNDLSRVDVPSLTEPMVQSIVEIRSIHPHSSTFIETCPIEGVSSAGHDSGSDGGE